MSIFIAIVFLMGLGVGAVLGLFVAGVAWLLCAFGDLPEDEYR